MELTGYHLELMKHTYGNGERNFYGTMLEGKDAAALNELVEAGYAGKRRASTWMIDQVIFHLTASGIAKLKERHPEVYS